MPAAFYMVATTSIPNFKIYEALRFSYLNPGIAFPILKEGGFNQRGLPANFYFCHESVTDEIRF